MNTSIAGSFLRAWPRDEWKISNQEFIIILRVRLGLSPIQAPCLGEIKCICSGQPILDEEGEHLFVCRKSYNNTLRHNDVVQALVTIAHKAGITSSTSFLQRVVHANQSQVDLVFHQPNFDPTDLGRPYVFDTTVVHPNCSSHRDRANGDPASLFQDKSRDKNTKYKAVCEAEGRIFVPLPIMTYGNVSPELEKLMRQLTLKLAEATGWQSSRAHDYIAITIAIHLQRQNARLLQDNFNNIGKQSYRDSQPSRYRTLASFQDENSFHDCSYPSQVVVLNAVADLPVRVV